MLRKDEHGILMCPKCGSKKFRVKLEQTISDVTSEPVCLPGDIIANSTIENEAILDFRCAKCGASMNKTNNRLPLIV